MSKPPLGTRKGCNSCRHLQPGFLFTTCAAFPAGIPAMFANGEALHDRAFPGDNGIKYEPRPAEQEPEKPRK